MKHDVDRTLIYLTSHIIECFRRLHKCQSRVQAQEELTSLTISAFADGANFPLNDMFTKPTHDGVGKFFFQ
jgi:hypothetical protein